MTPQVVRQILVGFVPTGHLAPLEQLGKLIRGDIPMRTKIVEEGCLWPNDTFHNLMGF